MPDDTKDRQAARKPYVSPPPAKADVDQLSRDQALIADEWAPNPPPPSPGAEKDAG